MIRIALLSLLALAAAAPATAQVPVRTPAVNYNLDRNWLCLPGRSDVCSTPLGTTALNPNGYGSVGRSTVARNAPVDCFFVYPTVSGDQGMNSDLTPDVERGAVESQFARFAGVCRPFVPIYRQMTLGAVAAAAVGGDVRAPGELAYNDVANAWRTYLAKSNKGRPFVLIGHSQGSLMIQELIKREIEGKPVARRMLRAIIPGFNVLVPQGKLVGGTFKSTPLCSSPAQTGCVMSWVSFRERNVPPEGALFGLAPPGMTVACTNPRAPRLDRLGAARQLLQRALRLARRRRPDPLVQPRRAADQISSAPKAWSPPAASPTAAAATCRSAPTPTPTTGAPTASAAKSRCSACSCPAGACTSPTWRSPRAT